MPEWLVDYPIEDLEHQIGWYYKKLENQTPYEKDERFNTISEFFEWDLENVELTLVRNLRRKKEGN